MFSRTLLGCSLLVTSLTAAGCDHYYKSDTGNDSGSSTTTTTPSAVPSINKIGWNCDENAYWFDVLVEGPSVGGWLYIYQTGSSSPWTEDHPVEIYNAAADGSTPHLYLDLPSVYPDYTAVISGRTTLYDCSKITQMHETLTFVMEIDDLQGNLQVDCAMWGHNTDAVPSNQEHCDRITPETAARLF